MNSWSHCIVVRFMQETRLEYSRGDVCPPKRKSRSSGMDGMAIAMWFQSVEGNSGQLIGFSSSGLWSGWSTHSTAVGVRGWGVEREEEVRR